MTRMVVEHVRDRVPGLTVDDLLRRAGETRDLSVLLDDGSWSTYAQIRALLEAAAQLLGGPDKLADIGIHAAVAAGSMPDSTGAMQDLGSPDAILTEIGTGQNGISPLLRTESEQHGPGDWSVRFRLPSAYAPFAELCWFNVGIDRLIPAMFGFTDIDTHEETCVRRGDEWCSIRVRWRESDEAARLVSFLQSKLEVSNSRLEAFQRTVAELVSDDDLDTILSRVVMSAAHAVRASGFVLALEELPWWSSRVYSEGLTLADAEAIATRGLAAGEAGEIEGGFAVDVVSTRRRYGRLIAVDHGAIMSHERGFLDMYARLAATALDSATALEEARRQASIAHALLDLSSALAHVDSTDAMAVKLAQAVPLVLDCDCSMVVLIDRASGYGRVAALHGFESPRIKVGMGLPLSSDTWMGTLLYHSIDLTSSDRAARQFMDRTDIVAMVTLPVMAEGRPLGVLVAAVRTDPQRLHPTAELEERLRGLAGQAATALRNATLVEQIRHQALHDSLTGLPNRSLLLDRAEQMLIRSRRQHTPSAALYIDLDNFKVVNDMFGHAAGDQLLCALADRLTSAVRASDTVGRIHGDEFILLVEGDTLASGPEAVAERVLGVIREPFHLPAAGGHPVHLTASIGIAEGTRLTAGDLLRDADLALYQGKASGKDRHVTFAAEMQAMLLDRLQTEEKLRRALERDEFFLLYQPTFALDGQRITGVEALLRWHPAGDVVMPDVFIPLLEASGLIVDVGRWVLREACAQSARWVAEGHHIDVAVNLSARQLEDESLIDDVRCALAQSGLAPSSLTLEITETTVMRDPATTLRILNEIRRLGVRLAIDDFGTGYSSLAYLQQFPIDTIKIDRSFIDRLAGSREAAALVRTLVQLGKTLGLLTMAEGIETFEQLHALQREGCDSGQGYLVSRPVSADEVVRLMLQQRSAMAESNA